MNDWFAVTVAGADLRIAMSKPGVAVAVGVAVFVGVAVDVNVGVGVLVFVGVFVTVQFATVTVAGEVLWFAWPLTKRVAVFENDPVLQLTLLAFTMIVIVAVAPGATEPLPQTTVSLPLFGTPVAPHVMPFVAVALTNATCAGRTSVIALGCSVNEFALLLPMLSV